MKSLTVLGSLLLLAACGGNATPSMGPQTSAAACSGRQVVTVMNDWTSAIDVYAKVGDDATPIGLGTVLGGGQTEFTLQPGVTSVYATAAGGLETASTRLAIRRLVRFRHLCQ